MMKYQYNSIESRFGNLQSVQVMREDESIVSFPAVVGNPNYDAFLEQAKLTDKQVKALTPDTWYDFPEGE